MHLSCGRGAYTYVPASDVVSVLGRGTTSSPSSFVSMELRGPAVSLLSTLHSLLYPKDSPAVAWA